jgi:hypothetical protein
MKTLKLLFIPIFLLVTSQFLWAQITIMPLGDSITRGTPGSADETGYRRRLYLLLQEYGYDVNFVGSLQNGLLSDFDRDHEGHGGFSISGIRANINNWLDLTLDSPENPPPNIILLHIGTISISQNPSYTTASEVSALLDDIDRWETTNNKPIIVVLAEIINRKGYTCGDRSTTTTFNNNVKAMAESRINDKNDKIILVDMECSAGLDYILDMFGDPDDFVHPNEMGFEKMADTWLVDGLLRVLPHADAGVNQSANEGTIVTLDGSGSIDPAGASLSYFWEQIPPGTPVTLSDQTAENPTFTAPEVGLSGERLNFKLTVTDANGFQHSDNVVVDITDVLLPPVADAGSNQTVAPGAKVRLDGSNSYDPDGTLTSVQWEQISGTTQVSLTNPRELISEFTAPLTGGEVLGFKLTLRDNNNQVSEDTANVTITSTEGPIIGGVGSGSGGGGCFIQAVMN